MVSDSASTDDTSPCGCPLVDAEHVSVIPLSKPFGIYYAMRWLFRHECPQLMEWLSIHYPELTVDVNDLDTSNWYDVLDEYISETGDMNPAKNYIPAE